MKSTPESTKVAHALASARSLARAVQGDNKATSWVRDQAVGVAADIELGLAALKIMEAANG